MMKVGPSPLILTVVLIFSFGNIVTATNKKFDAIEQVPLIPRMKLFNNSEKRIVHISPDGQLIAYLAPHEGAMNIWVKSIEEGNDTPITESESSIHAFWWTYDNQNILFTQNNSANKCFHIYKVNIKTTETVDMTPFDGVSASIHSLDKKYPNQVLITLNKIDQKGADVYRLEIHNRDMRLVARNLGNIDVWSADTSLQVRGAVVAEDDGTTTLLVRKDDSSAWEKKERWDFEDSLPGSTPPKGSRPVGFSGDGCSIYLIESKGVDTQRLMSLLQN